MLVLWSNNESRLSPLFASNRKLKHSVFVQTKHRITFEQFYYLFYAMSDISLSPRRAILTGACEENRYLLNTYPLHDIAYRTPGQ